MALVKYNNNSLSSVTSAAGFPAGALTLIKTLTASSSASVSFIHGSSDVVFDSTYPIYMFKWINAHHATGDKELCFQGTTDGSNFNVTMTSTYLYAYQFESGSASALSYDTARDQGQETGFQNITLPVKTDNDASSSGEMFIFNPSSTTFVKHFISRSSSYGEDSYAGDTYVAGYFNTTSAITGIQFKAESGNLDSGTIKLYGIKDS